MVLDLNHTDKHVWHVLVIYVNHKGNYSILFCPWRLLPFVIIPFLSTNWVGGAWDLFSQLVSGDSQAEESNKVYTFVVSKRK